MFGSLYVTNGKEDITFGIGNEVDQKNYSSLLNLYVHPFRRVHKRLRRKKIKQSEPVPVTEEVTKQVWFLQFSDRAAGEDGVGCNSECLLQESYSSWLGVYVYKE